MRRTFLFSLVTLILIVAIAAGAIFLAKGYRVSPQTGDISGTGILSITSLPDQASVYLDGHLTTATNTNINSLTPKTYDVRIVKEGFIDWEKQVEVKEGLVTEIKATLFRSLPSVYPLTYTGAGKVILSPDSQSIAYVVPVMANADATTAKESGLWVWRMSQQPISFARGAEPHQVAISQAGIDYSKADLKWSPDSSQILATFPDRQLLIDTSKLNDPAQDVTATVQSTLTTWNTDQKNKDLTRLQTIEDPNVRQVASSSAVLKWSPDETKILYCQQNCDASASATVKVASPTPAKSNYKVIDFLTNKTFEIPTASFYTWTPDSEHIILTESEVSDPSKPTDQNGLSLGKISIIEFDGSNKAEIYAGNFDLGSVIPWPDSSRLVVLSSFPTATASTPNLYAINLK